MKPEVKEETSKYVVSLFKVLEEMSLTLNTCVLHCVGKKIKKCNRITD